MHFSLIIANYNTAPLTKDCIESIFTHCRADDLEIIVVDNASRDNSVEILEQTFGSRIKVIKNQTNLGFATANNQAARQATGDYLFFLNSDTLLTEDILPEIKNIFAARPDIGIIAPTLLTSNREFQAGAHGRFPSLRQILSNKLSFSSKNKTSGNLIITDWVSGAALFIRREVFEKIGGWDSNFFMYLEDADLCWRAKKINFSTVISQKTSVIHLGGNSLAKSHERRCIYYSSQDYFFQKHYSTLTFWLMKILRWPYKKFVLTYKNEH